MSATLTADVQAGTCGCGCNGIPKIATHTRNGNVAGQPHRFLKGHNMRAYRPVGTLNPFFGRTHSKTTKQAISLANTGNVKSEELRRHLSFLVQGEKNPAFGKKYNCQRGENHHSWVGEEVDYYTLHQWVRRNKTKTGVCTHCKEFVGVSKRRGTQWSNVDHNYRRDLADYQELCRDCHADYDEVLRAS